MTDTGRISSQTQSSLPLSSSGKHWQNHWSSAAIGEILSWGGSGLTCRAFKRDRSVHSLVCPSLGQFTLLFWVSKVQSKGRPLRRLGCSKHFLWGIGDVKEAILVTVERVNLPHAGRHTGHALLCHQQKQGLCRLQINFISEQTEKLTQREFKRNQEFCLVQEREGLFTNVALNNYGQLIWKFSSDVANFIFSCGCRR